MNVIPAQTWSQQKAFLDFPWKLYKDDPNWIPPIRADQTGLVGFKTFGWTHPFYEENEGQSFIAIDGKKVLGTITAIWNKAHIARHKDGVGFLGFFDCIDDKDVASALFDTVSQWLKERGCTVMRGPVNPSLNHTLGLLIEGFHEPPKFMMTYNPPYYEKLFEENGFKKEQDLFAFWGEISMFPEVNKKWQPVCDRIVEQTGVVTRMVNQKNFREEVTQFLHIYNRALTNTW